MRYERVYNRPKGTIETFSEDASRASDIAGVAIDNMVASVMSGQATITNQTYSSAEEALTYTVSFNYVGTSIIKVSTTYTGLDDVTISLYSFRTISDGTGSSVGYE